MESSSTNQPANNCSYQVFEVRPTRGNHHLDLITNVVDYVRAQRGEPHEVFLGAGLATAEIETHLRALLSEAVIEEGRFCARHELWFHYPDL